ncbi:MerR family transcriptional regulator [Paenibacillus sp. ISL-20]|uniref:MerR family transcriptional regulator n=1 Tax=Paenibacillus sp. ISL-20 TaxID=2819163 RepID=UPI001BED2AAC|nr:MerR family transcriptional regulator [Paenibacillus sp. ISL-20]MBT2761366.1 MerR family transcriptional regulator [Paenibacillus sp. ISL-20]
MTKTIKDISERFGLSQDTLRYYERIGLIPPVNRNKNGIREYTEEDIKWVDFIKCMRQSAGLPVEVLIEYVTLFQQGDDTLQTRKGLLIEQRNRLADKVEEMTNTLVRLNDKIARYEQTIIKKEKTLRMPAD